MKNERMTNQVAAAKSKKQILPHHLDIEKISHSKITTKLLPAMHCSVAILPSKRSNFQQSEQIPSDCRFSLNYSCFLN